MAATQKTTGTAGNANINGDTLEKLNKGETPRSPRQERKDDKRLLAISDKACITALEKALGFGKSALNLEIAVGLSIFCFAENGADRDSKRHLTEIYKEAGFDINPNGEDYKTVNRRINATAALYDKYDRSFFIEAMDGAKEGKAIEALKNFITTEFNFNGINAVLAAAGKPVKQYNTPEYRAGREAQGDNKSPEQAGGQPEGQPEGKPDATPTQAATPQDQATAAAIGERMEANRAETSQGQTRRVNDAPNSILLATEHLHLAIPRDITREELQEMALKIMAFASDMDFEAEAKKEQKHAGAAQTQH